MHDMTSNETGLKDIEIDPNHGAHIRIYNFKARDCLRRQIVQQ